MLWRERGRENREQNGGPPCGQVRVLLVGDSGVGKTSLVHLIIKGFSILCPAQTIGCTVGVKHITYGSSGSSSYSIKPDVERDFFIELWDVAGHERYKDCRFLFYSRINVIIFVHDLSQKRTKTSLRRWAAEIAANGTFSAPLGSGGPYGLPVPYIVIGNKADIAAKEGKGGSSCNLVDVALQWVEKQGLLPSGDELPLTDSFPGSGDLFAAAKEEQCDKEAIMKFFYMLIRRRYYSDNMPSKDTWSSTPIQRPFHHSRDNLSDDDIFQTITSSSGDPYKYNMLPPLPAQHNLTSPPSLYLQQPVSISENYSFPRFSQNSTREISYSRRGHVDM
ncbi:Small GTPase [Dillenia turbinata]|uniref:Small GTPase n=1 Tax=Dillenia turbinata TaxID=194707 RepID=A0AAN8VQM6_9MAGN